MQCEEVTEDVINKLAEMIYHSGLFDNISIPVKKNTAIIPTTSDEVKEGNYERLHRFFKQNSHIKIFKKKQLADLLTQQYKHVLKNGKFTIQTELWSKPQNLQNNVVKSAIIISAGHGILLNPFFEQV